MQPNRPPAFNPAYNSPFDQSTPPPPYPGLPLPTQPVYQNMYPSAHAYTPQPFYPHVPQPFAHAGAGTLPPGYPAAPQPHVNVSPVFPSVHSHIPSGTFPAGYPGTYLPTGSPHLSHQGFAGHGTQAYSPGNVGFVFRPSAEDVRHRRMKIGYCSSLDCYVYPTDHRKKVSGWRSCVYDERNIAHKVEHDWKMAYLARVPNAASARIEWRFDFSGTGFTVKTVKLRFPTKIYNTGSIRVSLITKNETKKINHERTDEQKFKRLHHVQHFSIVAELCGGAGNEAWQHTQLFRQELKDSNSIFDVCVKLQNEFQKCST